MGNDRKRVLLRDLPDQELKRGECLYIYWGHTYGCIRDGGVAVTAEPCEYPFFEVPEDALGIPPDEIAIEMGEPYA